MQSAMDVCDLAIARMRSALQPGITENQLWSLLHETNIAHGGEWIECRLLSSGPRTNPWFQESADRVIQAGDIVGFDTDLVGPFGYLADISRSWICPGGRTPTDRHRRLYLRAGVPGNIPAEQYKADRAGNALYRRCSGKNHRDLEYR